jgi:hypothetical protein
LRKRDLKLFREKSLGATEFYEKMAFTNLAKTDVILIYGEARGRSELALEIYGERFPKDPSQCTNLCKRCAASSRFRAFRNE